MIYHVHLNIEALLKLPYEQFKREYDGVFMRDGKPMDALAALLAFQDMVYKGQCLLSAEPCNNFNSVTGCQGHEVSNAKDDDN